MLPCPNKTGNRAKATQVDKSLPSFLSCLPQKVRSWSPAGSWRLLCSDGLVAFSSQDQMRTLTVAPRAVFNRSSLLGHMSSSYTEKRLVTLGKNTWLRKRTDSVTLPLTPSPAHMTSSWRFPGRGSSVTPSQWLGSTLETLSSFSQRRGCLQYRCLNMKTLNAPQIF